MNKPTLWVMCGLSGSGKSTIAAEIANNNPNTVIVSSDTIREELTDDYADQKHNDEVFKVFHSRIYQNLENGMNVVADATNLTMKSRRAILIKVNNLDIHKVCVIIPKSFEDCKVDNLKRKHSVPNEILDKQIRSFQIPFDDEGWDDIQTYDLSQKDYEPIRISPIEMKGFDQKNPYHTLDLYDHCMHVLSELFNYDYAYPWEFIVSVIFHDYGKMKVQTFDENGIAHYPFHSNVGAYWFLTSGYLSEPYNVLKACFFINYHMMPFDWKTDKIKRRWEERFGEYKYQMLLHLHKCDTAK